MALDSGYWETYNPDIVEVVRCKDCKYWQDATEGIPNGGRAQGDCSQHEAEYWYEDDFCSCGERKTDG